MQRYHKGFFAEFWVCFLLICKGYRPLKHRYKTSLGEIDLIMKKGGELIFIEVKYRKNLEDALLSVSITQQKRIQNAAELFMKQSQNMLCRFDICALYGWGKLHHVENAF